MMTNHTACPTAQNIEQESDDIFDESEEETEESTKEGVSKQDNQGCEMEAAATLTSLVISTPVNKDTAKSHAEQVRNEFAIPEKFTKSGRKRAVPFTLKLMNVLSQREFIDIIAWTPSGLSFNVIDTKAFATQIHPTYFKNAQYSSFTRKLHRWGFMKHYRGVEAGAFYHKFFQRDRLDLVEKMTCCKDHEKALAPVAKKIEKAEPLAPKPTIMAPLRDRVPNITSPKALSSLSPVSPMFPSPVSAWPMNQTPIPHCMQAPSTAADLNAVIEMEVSRRLAERVTAAAQSRQALAILQQQLKQPPPSPFMEHRMMALQQHQQQQQQQQQRQREVSSGFISNSDLISAYRQAAFKQQLQSYRQNFATALIGRSEQLVGSTLATNIQIAKSA